MNKKIKFVRRGVALVLLLGTSFMMSSCTTETVDYNDNAPKYEMENTITKVVDEVENACIGVTASTPGNNYYSSGSGVVIKKEGNKYYAVTNYHVVEGYTTFKAYLNSSFSITSNLEFTYPGHDLACISFEASDRYNIKVANLPYEDSDKQPIINVGQTVIAIGCPLGIDNFNYTTVGVASTSVYTSYVSVGSNYTPIQIFNHDAPINSGNSGGALFDLDGNLIGINFRKIVSDDDKQMVEGMGEAIHYTEVISFLKNNGLI